MKSKFLVLAALLLVLSTATVTFAQAEPLKPKTNEKFQNFAMTGTYDLLYDVFMFDHQYIPSTDNTEKLVMSGEEYFTSMQLTIGDNTYTMGSDFTYKSLLKITYFDPVFPNNAPHIGNLAPASFRASMFIVDYTYPFLPASGITGTLNMHAININGQTHINSLSGTDDLINVQIQATTLPATTQVIPATSSPYFNTPPYYNVYVTIHHTGWVTGWPQ